MRFTAIGFLLVACVLIAAGRRQLWSYRRAQRRARGQWVVGWALQLLGLLAMVLAVVLW